MYSTYRATRARRVLSAMDTPSLLLGPGSGWILGHRLHSARGWEIRDLEANDDKAMWHKG